MVNLSGTNARVFRVLEILSDFAGGAPVSRKDLRDACAWRDFLPKTSQRQFFNEIVSRLAKLGVIELPDKDRVAIARGVSRPGLPYKPDMYATAETWIETMFCLLETGNVDVVPDPRGSPAWGFRYTEKGKEWAIQEGLLRRTADGKTEYVPPNERGPKTDHMDGIARPSGDNLSTLCARLYALLEEASPDNAPINPYSLREKMYPVEISDAMVALRRQGRLRIFNLKPGMLGLAVQRVDVFAQEAT